MEYTAEELREIAKKNCTERVFDILRKCATAAGNGCFSISFTLPYEQDFSRDEIASLKTRGFKISCLGSAGTLEPCIYVTISWEE